jgi:hypothetical protein
MRGASRGLPWRTSARVTVETTTRACRRNATARCARTRWSFASALRRAARPCCGAVLADRGERRNADAGGLGHPMTVLAMPSGLEVVTKDSRAGLGTGDVCDGCPFFPCHDALMALRLTADRRLQFCLLREDVAVPLAEALVAGILITPCGSRRSSFSISRMKANLTGTGWQTTPRLFQDLPLHPQPPVLVREFFELGPLADVEGLVLDLAAFLRHVHPVTKSAFVGPEVSGDLGYRRPELATNSTASAL